MTFDEVAYLLEVKRTVTDRGSLAEELIMTEVLVQYKSIGYREFYQAEAVGMKPQMILVMAEFLEYEGQKQVEFRKRRYDILKTFQKIGERTLELTLSAPINEGV